MALTQVAEEDPKDTSVIHIQSQPISDHMTQSRPHSDHTSNSSGYSSSSMSFHHSSVSSDPGVNDVLILNNPTTEVQDVEDSECEQQASNQIKSLPATTVNSSRQDKVGMIIMYTMLECLSGM